jgi:hypothetical protein
MSPAELVLRPRRGRHRRPVTLLAAIVGLFLVCGAAKIVDRASSGHGFRVPMLALLVALLLVPLLWLMLLSTLNTRNVALRVGQGRLSGTGWTGRTVTVEHPDYALDYGDLMVVGGQGAVVFVPRWWDEGDILTMLGALGLRPQPGQGSITRRYPCARFPFSVRHPAVFTVGMLAGSLGYLFLLTYLVLQF